MSLCGDKKKLIVLLSDIEEHDKIHLWLHNSGLCSDIDIFKYYSMDSLYQSGNFYCGDVYIVECNVKNGINGRYLYDMQKENRIELVPFLFVTNRILNDGDYKYFSEKYLTNAFDYITKPIIENQLIHKMKNILTFISSDGTGSVSEDVFYNTWKKTILDDRKRLRLAREKWNNLKKSMN